MVKNTPQKYLKTKTQYSRDNKQHRHNLSNVHTVDLFSLKNAAKENVDEGPCAKPYVSKR